MVNNMKIDDKIIAEIQRYNNINKYVVEQALPGEEPLDAPPADAGVPPTDSGSTPPIGGATPPAAPGGDTTPVDTTSDPDVEKIDDSGKSEESTSESGSEELDITDLVNSQKNIETKQDEYFQNLFSHLENLETKLSEMDKIVNQLNSLEQKIEKYREKTPQEKLELRSLDSGPYNQKLSDFFVDKEQDMEKSGKNEYVLTTDDVEEYSPLDISRTFRDFDPEQLAMK
jgi:hypothetical protein